MSTRAILIGLRHSDEVSAWQAVTYYDSFDAARAIDILLAQNSDFVRDDLAKILVVRKDNVEKIFNDGVDFFSFPQEDDDEDFDVTTSATFEDEMLRFKYRNMYDEESDCEASD